MNNVITIDTSESLRQHTASRVRDVPVYNFVNENDPILKQKTVEFNFDDDSLNPSEISDRLIQTLKASRNAFGLAAPQVGLPYRVFAMGSEENYSVLFNPRLSYISEETVHMEEGCLSFPFLILSITRPKEVHVEYQNKKGEWDKMGLTGLSARVVLHEMDHLDGITFNTVAKPLALKMALKKREKYQKKFANYIMSQRKMVNL